MRLNPCLLVHLQNLKENILNVVSHQMNATILRAADSNLKQYLLNSPRLFNATDGPYATY